MFKKIGVIICEATATYQTEILKGINSQAHSLGYDVLVFATFIKVSYFDHVEHGERNIFNLINFDELDGVIVVGDSLRIRGLKEELFPRLQHECSCPVVFIDSTNDMGFDNITTNDTLSFEEITDHLIDVHGCRKILFYSGPYEVSSSQTRFEGYKNSLKKHNMDIDPDYVSFDGNFWIESGEQVAREIIEGKRPRPDAIAFCGDHMAISAQQTFQAAGWNIPNDIIITGYDAIDQCLKCTPPITSCSPPISAAGANAVISLDAKIRGITPTAWITTRGRLEIGGSCGCCEDAHYTKRIYYRNETSLKYEEFLDSSMMESLAEADDFDFLLTRIHYFLFLIQDWKEFHLCLCNNWLSFDALSNTDGTFSNGYPDKMVHYIKSTSDDGRILQDVFNTNCMLPILREERPAPVTYYFVPVHMNWKCFGYAVLSYGNTNKVFDINFKNWIRHISNALEYFRLQSRVSNMALIDVLTGAYTRMGIKQHIKVLLNRIHDTDHRFLVMMVDLDNLKYINDSFGHQAGDQAICEIVNALHSVTTDMEMCARIGGDEFVILGCDNYSDDHIDKVTEKVFAKLATVNEMQKYPFDLSASIGGAIGTISEAQEIDSLYQIADQQMYSMKKEHHKNNTSQ